MATSIVQDIVDRVGVILLATVAGSTLLKGTKPPDTVKNEELPLLVLFGVSSVSSEELEWRQFVQLVTFSVIGYFDKTTTPDQLWQAIEDIRDAIHLDFRLGNTVKFTTLIDAIASEAPAREVQQQTFLITIQAERLDP